MEWGDAALLAAIVFGIGWNGAFSLFAQLGMGAILLAGLASRLLASDADLAPRANGLPWLMMPLGAVVLDVVFGVPLPSSFHEVVFPETAAAYPNHLRPATLDGWGLMEDVLQWTLVAAGMLLASRTGKARIRIERGAAVATVALGVALGQQLLTGAEALYGVIPVAASDPWAPLVNRNFLAFLVVGLQFPIWGALWFKRQWDQPWTWFMMFAAPIGLIIVVASGSAGSWLAAATGGAVLLGAALAPDRLWPRLLVLPVAGSAVGTLVLAGPDLGLDDSLASRSDMWWRTLALVARQPLGFGPGSFSVAFRPFQDPTRFVQVDHAHHDLLQAAVEFGLPAFLIMGCLGVALVLTLPARPVNHRSAWLDATLVAWSVQALVDFPLQSPALSVLVGTAWVWRATAWSPSRPRPDRVRASTLAGAAALVIGLTCGVVRWFAPGSPEPAVHEAVELARRGSADRVRALLADAEGRWPNDPDLLVRAGAALAVVGDLDAADRAVQRAILRHASDHRSRALASRIAQARGDREGAIRWWVEALRRWPYELAIQERPFARALQLQPAGLWWVSQLESGADPLQLVLLGQELANNADWASAALALDAAAARRPQYRTIGLRGEAHIRAGRMQVGLDLLADAARADTDGSALRARARALAAQGRWREALVDAQESLIEAPGNLEARILVLQGTSQTLGPKAALEAADRMGRPETLPPGVAATVAAIARDQGYWTDCMRWTSGSSPRPPELEEIARQCEQR